MGLSIIRAREDLAGVVTPQASGFRLSLLAPWLAWLGFAVRHPDQALRRRKLPQVVLSAIRPGDCWPPDAMATISSVEGVKRGALSEMPIHSGQGAS
jgi:hypothetical protein